MYITPKRSRTLATNALCLISTCALIGPALLKGQQGKIIITSPARNSTVEAGSSLHVTIQGAPGTIITKASAFLYPESSPLSIVATPPFTIPVSVPSDTLGMVTLIALAVDTQGNSLQVSIPIVVSTSRTAQSISVNPSSLLLLTPDQLASLQVTGKFDDGVSRDLTNAAGTSYKSSNVNVVAIAPGAIVQPAGPGKATITISYGSLSAVASIAIATFPLRGDLDGNGDIDKDDLNILLKVLNKPATGPTDPRDLNGDGRIDALDARILVTLCTRASCATH